ncbi:MAG: hypothetical protein IJW48_00220 [Clostridia bacterium]|nr:hypothetical protein [Clostridia bacterium]
MKKRIISLILVAVMAVIALAGCAYSYEKDDMSNYATFDKDAFFAALADGTITVEDGDFGTDEDERQKKVLDAIYASLAKNADTDVKITEGVAGVYDSLYYCYYATVTDDAGVEHVLYASKMTESSPTNFQLGLSTLEGLNLKIAEMIAGKDVADYIYTTIKADDTTDDVTDKVTKAGDTVYVSYTKEYTALAFNDDGTPTVDEAGAQLTETKKVTVSYEKLTLNGADNTFLKKLEGLVVGETNTFDVTNNELDTEDKTEKYTNVKVNWIVKNENEIGTVKDTPYTTSKTEKNVYGEDVQLQNKELTYHIFPVYLIDVEDELTAEVVLDKFYSQLSATTTDDDGNETYEFASVESGNYKNGEKTLAELVDELAELRVELSDAEEALEDAEEALEEAGDKKTEAQETAVTDAKTKLTETEGKVDAKEAEILAATNEAGEDIRAALVADMKQYQYDTLLDSYKSTLKQSLAEEIFALAKKYMTFKTYEENGYPILPKKAVQAAYKRIENGHKYDFYEGTYTSSSSSSSSSSESNYYHYEGDYDEFLKVEYFSTDAANHTMQDVYDQIGAAAEESVRGVIRMYVIAEAFEEKYSADLSVTDEQIDEFKETYLYYLFGSSMEESDYKTALLCDNIFDYILEETAEADYVEDAEYGKNKIQYLRVKYSFKD